MGPFGKTRIAPGLLLVVLVLSGCGSSGAPKRELEAAQRFDRFPLYWVGERFEKLELRSIQGLDGTSEFVTFVYGTCKPSGGEQPSCAPPLEIQLFPLCSHLDVVAAAPSWKKRTIRNAPVGTIDNAPVLFSRRAQVKVYRGQGSDAGLPLRALRALRSINGVKPVLGTTGQIPAPEPGILEGTRACSTS